MPIITYENIDFSQYSQDEYGYSNITLYHGCIRLYDVIKLTDFGVNGDFGQAFYTTVIKQQAIEWAYKKCLIEHKPVQAIVYTFNFKVKIKEDQVLNLKIKKFNKMDKAWLDEITNNRLRQELSTEGIIIPKFDTDIIIGPMLDGKNIHILLRDYYNSGRKNPNKYITLMKFRNKDGTARYSNQVAFCSYKALRHLRTTNVELILYKKGNNYAIVTHKDGDYHMASLNNQFKSL
jgi:hypothetical protein